jgi:hypothetical protein
MQLPSGALISNVSITHNTPNFKTESLNLKEKVKARGLHRLEGTCDITIGETIQDQKEWNAFLLTLQGSYGSFVLDLPRHFKSEDLVANPTITVGATVGQNQLQLSAFTGTIFAGSCFTVPNDTKIYYILNTVVGGETAIIYPALRQDILVNSTIEFINPVITARFKEDSQTVDFTENGFIIESTMEWNEVL